MADNTNRPDQRNGGGTAEVLRRGARITEEAMHQGGEATERALGQGRRAGAELARAATEGTAAVQAEAVRRGGETGAEVLRRTGEASEAARRTAQASGSGFEALWRAMPVPGAAMGNLPDFSQAVAGLWGDLLRTQMRIGQEVFRMANPVAVIEMQQRLVHGYLDALLNTQNTLLGAARRTEAEAQQQAGRSGKPGI